MQNQAVQESSKDIKPRLDIASNDRKSRPARRSQSKATINNRILSQKQSQKNIKQPIVNKSVNLFDGIQNFLENPHEAKKESPQLIGLSLLKAKRDIEDKLRVLNMQLGHPE